VLLCVMEVLREGLVLKRLCIDLCGCDCGRDLLFDVDRFREVYVVKVRVREDFSGCDSLLWIPFNHLRNEV
jgi:hypothetical protein